MGSRPTRSSDEILAKPLLALAGDAGAVGPVANFGRKPGAVKDSPDGEGGGSWL